MHEVFFHLQGFSDSISVCRCRGTPKPTLTSMPGLFGRCLFMFVVFGRDRKTSVIGRCITCATLLQNLVVSINLFFSIVDPLYYILIK